MTPRLRRLLGLSLGGFHQLAYWEWGREDAERTVVCVHGNADVDVPLSQSERYVAAAQAAGDPARLIVLPGTGHMELVDPTSTAWAICREQLLRML